MSTELYAYAQQLAKALDTANETLKDLAEGRTPTWLIHGPTQQKMEQYAEETHKVTSAVSTDKLKEFAV